MFLKENVRTGGSRDDIKVCDTEQPLAPSSLPFVIDESNFRVFFSIQKSNTKELE